MGSEEHMHVVIQRYRVRLGVVADAARYADKWFVPLLREIPGFGACYLMNAGSGVLGSIAVFETAEGAEAASRLAHEWFSKEWGSFRPLPPEVISGEVLAPAAVAGQPQTGRRWVTDRRRATLRIGAGAPSAIERRAGSDRRQGFDRRADFVRLFEQQAVG
jgi:hypothetical protein